MKTAQSLALMILSISISLHAQNENLNPVKQEMQAIELLLLNETALDSLTNLALDNSYYVHGFEAELGQQYENVRQEKNKWYSTFRLGVNFFSLATSVNNQDQSVTRAGILPNLGLSLSIDPEKFINRGSYVREAQLNVTRAESQVNHQKKMLRKEIVGLYYQYLEVLGIILLREEAKQYQQQQVTLLEERFKKGEARLEDLLNNQGALALASEALLRSQLAAKKMKQEMIVITSDTERYFASRSKNFTYQK
jgi:outer membrane protein TolC